MSNVTDLTNNVLQHKYNPAGIQRSVLGLLNEVLNGEINIVDASNPFIFNLEASSTLTAAAMSEAAALTHKQYPMSALTKENLYNHMSDKDFVDCFATPSSTKFGILISKEELDNKVVYVPELGISKIVIPRNTTFTIADTVFSLQYPIEIRLMAHGGYQIVYDGEIKSPLQTLSTNHIDFDILENSDGQFLYFEVDVTQFSIISKTGSLSPSVAFKLETTIEDQFYYCRVYHQNSAGGWDELATTYTTDIYDIATPTAVVKVDDKIISVEIPQIYTIQGVLTRTIRVDIYQTKGPLNMILSEYSIENFVAKWLALDTNEQTEYVAPLSSFRTIMAFSKYTVSGGTNGIGFEALRRRVMTNSVGEIKIPITPDQLTTLMEKKGYDIVKNIDSITNRIFVATRDLPTPTNKITRTAANAAIATVEMSMEETAGLSGVIDNGLRITITSDAVYKTLNGITKHVSKEEIASILSLSVDAMATAISNGNYFYSPFHYVLDATANEFALRPYYLDNPQITTKLFVGENDTTLLKVSVASYSIEKLDSGYRITVLTTSSDAYKELDDEVVGVQMGYYPPGESDRAYLNGTLYTKNESKERYFQFTLNTKFDIDADHYLYLTNFLMYTEDAKSLPAPLLTDFDVIFTTNASVGAQYSRSALEDAMGVFLLPAESKAINHEKLRVNFGSPLNTLWSRNRTVVSSRTYRHYDVDMPAVYQQDIYQIDPATGSTITIVDGEITYNVLHKKGDPVLDAEGKQVYAHRAGDLMLDENGVAIEQAPRKIVRLCDFFLIDGVYWFASAQAVIDYKKELTTTLVAWLTQDLANIEDVLLEQTRIYFYPKTTVGGISILANGGTKLQIPAQQSLVVTLYVGEQVYANEKLKEAIEENTITVLMAGLKESQISISGLEELLRQTYKGDVIEVSLSGFGGDDTIRVATILNNTTRCSVKKKLVSLADNTLSLTDDISVSFVRHRVTS